MSINFIAEKAPPISELTLAMKTFYKNREIYSSPCAIFRVPTDKRGDVFMRVERPNYNAERKAVVEVDARRFLNLWRQPHSSHPDIASGSPESWPSDYKYNRAEDGFLKGEANPVPLAYVSCGRARFDVEATRRHFLIFKKQVIVAPRGAPFLAFTNGITRTIWLLTQGAAIFPVLCSLGDAKLLQEHAGVHNGVPIVLANLVPKC